MGLRVQRPPNGQMAVQEGGEEKEAQGPGQGTEKPVVIAEAAQGKAQHARRVPRRGGKVKYFARITCICNRETFALQLPFSKSCQHGPMRWSLLLVGLLPGAMAQGLYAHTQAGLLAPAVRGVPERVYVPNEKSHTVTVIDPKTYRVLATFPVPSYPEHVVPSWDLKTLYVASKGGDALVPIDPKTGRPGRPIPVADPYNLYFTPDGAHALVVAENRRELRYHDPRTFRLQARLKVPCRGVNHLDFSEDGRYFLAACEWSGDLLKVRTEPLELLGKLHVGGDAPGRAPC